MRTIIILFLISVSINSFSQVDSLKARKDRENSHLKKRIKTNEILIEDLIKQLVRTSVKDSIDKKVRTKIVYIKVYNEPIKKYILVSDTLKGVPPNATTTTVIAGTPFPVIIPKKKMSSGLKKKAIILIPIVVVVALIVLLTKR